VAAQRYPLSPGQACEARHTTLRQTTGRAKNFVEKRLSDMLPEPGGAVRGEAVLRDAGMTARDPRHSDLVPLVALFGGLGVCFWVSWLAIPLFLCQGVIYSSAAHSRWRECRHRTPARKFGGRSSAS
jgi:hypothetical protein